MRLGSEVSTVIESSPLHIDMTDCSQDNLRTTMQLKSVVLVPFNIRTTSGGSNWQVR